MQAWYYHHGRWSREFDFSSSVEVTARDGIYLVARYDPELEQPLPCQGVFLHRVVTPAGGRVSVVSREVDAIVAVLAGEMPASARRSTLTCVCPWCGSIRRVDAHGGRVTRVSCCPWEPRGRPSEMGRPLRGRDP